MCVDSFMNTENQHLEKKKYRVVENMHLGTKEMEHLQKAGMVVSSDRGRGQID